MDKIWILWWSYGDGSSLGIVRAYEDEQRAREDFELVEDSTDKEYALDEFPYIKQTLTDYLCKKIEKEEV